MLKLNDVQKVKNPRGYTGSVLKSLQGSKLWCIGGFRTVLLFEFTWCLINVIFVAELLVYLLCASYVLELLTICTFKWIFTYRRGGRGVGGTTASINTDNPAKRWIKWLANLESDKYLTVVCRTTNTIRNIPHCSKQA